MKKNGTGDLFWYLAGVSSSNAWTNTIANSRDEKDFFVKPGRSLRIFGFICNKKNVCFFFFDLSSNT